MKPVNQFSRQQRIINTLLLNASFIDNPGLMHGKMGISIFFFHLARQTENKTYEDYAGELIDEIYEEISTKTPVDFENGLAGIGWGIEYLVQNGFIEANTNEVLEEFDKKIFNKLIHNTPAELNLLNGILGVGAYLLKRFQGSPILNFKHALASTNRQTLIYLLEELDRRTQNITEIIFEPSNTQTIEPQSQKSQTENNKNFDLTWDYPVLLWFLSEIYQIDVPDTKVEEIIQQLVKPLSTNANFPKLYPNRLLLALALTKLQKTINNKQQPPEQSNLQTALKQLSILTCPF